MRLFLHILISVFLSGLAGVNPALSAEGRTILVLDASGSMWAKLGERHKIEIARDVFAQLMTDLPEERELGVVAYGHRRKSDCRDIQEIAGFDTARETMIKRVRKLNPRGKTPLGGAVEFAADRLNHKEEPATVILVSDGNETCRRNPCAVAEQLEEEGLDFTVHVVGFDIDDKRAEEQLQCLAERTGGTYFSAANQGELSEALTQTFSASSDVDPSTPANLTLQATMLDGGVVVTSGLDWTIRVSRSGAPVMSLAQTGPVSLEIAPGLYDIHVRRRSDGGESELRKVRLRPGAARVETLVLPVDFSATVSPAGGNEVAVNSEIEINWTGRKSSGDFIALSRAGSADDAFLVRKVLRDSVDDKLHMPTEPGDYELRYVYENPQVVLARAPVFALDVVALVIAPETAPAFGSIDVDWRGPGFAGDIITIVPAGADDAEIGVVAPTTETSPARLAAPETPGLYEVRYLLAGERVLARRLIEITRQKNVIARLRAPETAFAGSTFEVIWDGPGGASDQIAITRAEDDNSATIESVSVGTDKRVSIAAPLTPGKFELRYVQDGVVTLVRAPIEVREVVAEINAPEQVPAARPFIVRVSGPFAEGDLVTIADPDNPGAATDSMALFDDNEPLQMIAPRKPGGYEIRYLLGGKRVIASQIIAVHERS